MKETAKLPDLLGKERLGESWLDGLPRLVFVSDMGDAFSNIGDFDFLEQEIKETQTELGRRHLWLWLTKRPDVMAKFAQRIGGFADNICAMTTVTSDKTLSRIDSLRKVRLFYRVDYRLNRFGRPLQIGWTSVKLTG